MKRSSLCVCLLLAAVAFPAVLSAQTLTFAAPKTISFTLPDSAGAVTIAAADFNGDGKTDYLLESWNQGDLLDFGLLLGNGYGSFTQEQTNVPVPASLKYAVADVNGDGKADIITFEPGCRKITNFNNCPNGTYGSIKVYLNMGGGRFINSYTSTLPQFLDTISYAVVDFNGDKLPDIAVLSTTSSAAATAPTAALTVFLNTGAGLFTRHQDTNLPAAMTSFPTSTGNLVAGDFTGNGHNDLVFSYASEPGGPSPTGVVYRLPNNGTGSFGTPVLAYKFSSGGGADFITGDLNSDGRTDLVYGGPNRNMVVLLANATGGGFAVGPSLHYFMEFLWQAALSDLNGDGKLDLVLSGNSNNVATAAAYLGEGSGKFNTSYKALHPSGPWNTDSMAIAPLAKGDLPSIMFQTGPNTLELFANKTVK